MRAFRPLHRSVRLLFRKEVRQFLRSRQAVLTGLLLPALLMVVAPGVQLLSANSAGARSDIPAVVPGLSGIHDVRSIFLYFTFPLFVVLAGLMTPSLAAVYTVISERERRSIELLVALPVSVTDIVTAKLGANLAVAAVTLAPLFAVDAAVILLVTTAGPLFVLAAFLVLLSALTASIGVSLLLALVARDFRTANNLNRRVRPADDDRHRAVHHAGARAMAVPGAGCPPARDGRRRLLDRAAVADLRALP